MSQLLFKAHNRVGPVTRPLIQWANLHLARGNLCTPPLPLGRPTPHRNCLPETVPWPVQVVRIFIGMSISPSLSLRQCPDLYAFCAGRNLPDKEFRYLRTIIVTAAVHRGFGRRLPCHQVTNFLDLPALGRQTCVFGKQSPGPGHCDPLCEEAPLLSEVTGYFAEFLRESCLVPLGILYLATCVDFGYRYPFVEGRSSFSWEYGMDYFSAVAPGTRTLAQGIFSTPYYPEKAGAPCVLEPITIFRLT
ncbi:ORF91 protein [Spatholobus suberectus]|nr:ORF91 protein [Spatholobus suberectus]